MTERDADDRLLELGLSELTPSAQDKQRHRAALARWLEPNAAGSPLRERAPSPVRGWSALRASGAAGWTTGALLLSAGVGLGLWLQASIDERALRQMQPPAPSAAAVEAAPGRSAPGWVAPLPPPERSEAPSVSEPSPRDDALPGPTTAVEHSRPTVATKPARRATSHRRPNEPEPSEREPSGSEPVVAEPFDEELALLQRVERALRAKRSSVAVALLGELDERFPRTRLGEERQVARLIAECQLQLPEASQRGERFLEERGASVYASRVRAACAREAGDDFAMPEKANTPADTLRR